MIGKTISRYRIVEKLGEGGMGVVYRAEDTKLRRSVALKLLPAEATGSKEAQSRLLKEAEAAAALDHPNITTIYEVGEESGQHFIAMAFVDGKTLAQRIAERPLPLAEALDVASQVASALEAAHEGGVVHRDIKPGNIMLTEKGHVKVMDFGLAHLADQTRITRTGTIMGTPAYMSPEQVRGEEVDRRSDIWSLGVVLYEMVAGRRPFRAESSQVLALTIQNEEPEPLTALRSDVPMELDWVARKSLAKEPSARYQHAGEFGVDVRAARTKLGSGTRTTESSQRTSPLAATAPPAEVASRSRAHLPWALLAVVSILAILFGVLAFRHEADVAAEKEVRRFTLSLPVTVHELAVSPDGSHVVFATAGADGRLWIQDLDQFEPRELEGTEGAAVPFWSPDSQYVGYIAGNDLLKVSVAGGTPTRLCSLPQRQGNACWNPDGRSIVINADAHLLETSSLGGEAEPLRMANSASEPIRGSNPTFLPSERRRLVLNRGQEMYAVDLESGRTVPLGTGTVFCYASSGHIIYRGDLRGGIWALPFSPEKMETLGDAFPIATTGRSATVSNTGTLVYSEPPDRGNLRLALLDRSGEVVETIGTEPLSSFGNGSISPDGSAVAYSEGGVPGAEMDVWVYDLNRGIKTRVTSDPLRESFVAWSPTGRELAYGVWRSRDTTGWDIMVRPSDGSGQATELLATSASEWAQDWSQDGNRLLAVIDGGSGTGYDLWYLERQSDGDPWQKKPFLQTPHIETRIKFSPDERYVVYVSYESGVQEVYVRDFPEGDRKWQISSGGGNYPIWSEDGSEIFYGHRGAIYSVPVTTDPVFAPGTPVKLFEHWGLNTNARTYHATNDGQRFLVALPTEPPKIRVVQNWHQEFQDRH